MSKKQIKVSIEEIVGIINISVRQGGALVEHEVRSHDDHGVNLQKKM